MLSTLLLTLAINSSTICNAVVAVTTASKPFYKKSLPSRLSVCVEVVEEGQKQGVDPVLLAVLAWEESRWEQIQQNPKTYVIGPLQVQPRWWCPQKTVQGCNLTEAGVRAVKHYLTAHAQQGETVGLCHYNQGNHCGDRALRRAKFIYREVLSARRILRRSPQT